MDIISLYAYVLFLKKLDNYEPELVNLIKDFIFTKYSIENKPYIDLNKIAHFYSNIENTGYYLDENNYTFENYIPDYIKTYDFVTINSIHEQKYYEEYIKNQYTIKDIQELKKCCFNYFNKFRPDILEINRQIKELEQKKCTINNEYNPEIIKYDKTKKLKLTYYKKYERNNELKEYDETINKLYKIKKMYLNNYSKLQNKYNFM